MIAVRFAVPTAARLIPPVQHGDHHGKRQDADFGQLKGHRSQLLGLRNRSGLSNNITSITTKSTVERDNKSR